MLHRLEYDVRKIPSDMARIRELLSSRANVFALGSQSFREDGKRHNTAFTFGAGGELLGAHHKNRPVHFFDDGEPGQTLESFATPVGRIATPVCFDCDYTEVACKLVLDGAELILAPSMDAMRWTARQHEQHAELFRHRAAENGRWIAVAATSGVTQIIAPTGTVTARLDGMEPGVLVGEVALRNHKTFYSRFGWLLGPVCAFAAGLILLAAIVRALVTASRRKRSPQPAA